MSATILYLVPMTELPNRLRELRKARGWTLEKVALDAGTSIPTIADLEKGPDNGGMHLTLAWMKKLAPVFGVSVADLLLPGDNPHALDAAEAELIARYRAAGEAQRQQLLQMAAVIVPESEQMDRAGSHLRAA